MVADTMKRFLLICPLLLTLASAAHAEGNVRIVDVGLNHLCLTYQEPCPVVVTLSNPFPKPQDFELQIGVRPKEGPGEADPEHTYIHRLTLDALEERQIEAILPSSSYGDPVLEVTARIHQGVLTGHDWQSYKPEWMASGPGVGVVCDDESVCKKVQSQIQLSGSPEDRNWKNGNLQLAVPLRPRFKWWSYDKFSMIVVAAPISHLCGVQRAALESYARSGGSLVLLEDYLVDSNFLADYRRDAVLHRGEAPIGAGRLYVAREGESLETIFDGQMLYALLSGVQTDWTTPGPGLLQMEYATTFTFPRLGTVLIWLSITFSWWDWQTSYIAPMASIGMGLVNRDGHRVAFRLHPLRVWLVSSTAPSDRRQRGRPFSGYAQWSSLHGLRPADLRTRETERSCILPRMHCSSRNPDSTMVSLIPFPASGWDGNSRGATTNVRLLVTTRFRRARLC